MYIKQGKKINLVDSNVQSFPELSTGTYLTKFDERALEYYLEVCENFTVPKKIYGDSEKLSDRYIKSFSTSEKNMGILLTGLKGTGKSLTAKLTCLKSNLPIILVTEPFVGEGFKSFLNSITQEVVVFIDEFEKIYDDDETQQSLLSLLDGVFEGKKLFLFTSNMRDRINNYMLNRPGRIKYLAEYDSLSDDIVNEVIDDILIDKSHTAELQDVLDIIGMVSMDILVTLINEINNFGETPKQAAAYLNIRPESGYFDVVIFKDGDRLGSTSTRNHPLTSNKINIEFYNSKTMGWDDINVAKDNSELTRVGREITIKTDEHILVFKPQSHEKFTF